MKKKKNDVWGVLTSIDCYGCDPGLIRSKKHISKYVKELCKLIKMKRFGNCRVVYFGEDKRVAGYSMTQLIETSLISGHFANESNSAYIDIFSCSEYSSDLVVDFTKKYFCAKKAIKHIANRR